MEPTQKPRVKICCISSVEEAWLAIRYGASALGLVSRMPSGPGVIADELIAGIAAPVFLAGGLCAENGSEAISVVRPFGVDLCSGVRADGRLNETKLAKCFETVNQ